MAGHSKFKNIQFRKGAQDKKRAKIFAKISKEITVAAKLGLPDPNANPRLRSAIALGKAQNMPKDNIERAIKKSYDENGENYESVRYEGFGIEGVGLIVETLTDNRNRTAGDIRSVFSKHGGNLGETGSVSFMFNHLGIVKFPKSAGNFDDIFEDINKGNVNKGLFENEKSDDEENDEGFLFGTFFSDDEEDDSESKKDSINFPSYYKKFGIDIIGERWNLNVEL